MLILFLLLFVKRGTTKTEALVYYYCYLFSPPVLLLMEKKTVAHPPEHILRAAFSVRNGLWGGAEPRRTCKDHRHPPVNKSSSRVTDGETA